MHLKGRKAAFNIDWLRTHRDQLFAEAVEAEKSAGETITIDPSLWGEAATENDKRMVKNLAAEFLEDLLGDDSLVGMVTTEDIVRALHQSGYTKDTNSTLVSDAFAKAGWRKDRAHLSGRRQRVWMKGDFNPNRTRTLRDGNGVTDVPVFLIKWCDTSRRLVYAYGHDHDNAERAAAASSGTPSS